MHKTEDKLAFSIDEATQLLGLSRSTMRRLIGSGQMHGIVRVGRRILVTRKGIDRFLNNEVSQ